MAGVRFRAGIGGLMVVVAVSAGLLVAARAVAPDPRDPVSVGGITLLGLATVILVPLIVLLTLIGFVAAVAVFEWLARCLAVRLGIVPKGRASSGMGHPDPAPLAGKSDNQ